VIPAAFEYVRAESVDDAVAQITEAGDEAKFLAGGHSLLPLMKLRLAQPSVLVDLGRITDLSYIRDAGDHVAIGALTRHHDVEYSDLLADQVPLLAHTASLVGDPAVRHRGTIGGSVAHSDPASDLPATLLALGATFIASSAQGERAIVANDFFTGFLESALGPTEMLTEIRVPKSPGSTWNYQKFNRRAQDWAIVGVAAVHGDGHTGIGLVNMASTPLRAAASEAALASGASPDDAAQQADEGTDPSADLNASEEYRRHLARVLVRRALVECATRG
jgi:carbon-monoxide dehydrogenase medium subunit